MGQCQAGCSWGHHTPSWGSKKLLESSKSPQDRRPNLVPDNRVQLPEDYLSKLISSGCAPGGPDWEKLVGQGSKMVVLGFPQALTGNRILLGSLKSPPDSRASPEADNGDQRAMCM